MARFEIMAGKTNLDTKAETILMARSKKIPAGRRDFLKSVVAGAATLATPVEALPAQPVEERSSRVMPLLPPMIESDPPADADVLYLDRSGSDFMVDVIKSLGIEYVCSVAGSSFRALHESVINYGGNQNPEFITCCHEESSVAMAQGYAKIEGKPLCIFAHGTVGLQHASMAIFNAFCDRVPVYIVIGNNLDVTKRDSAYGEWPHSVQDAAAMVRDYTKWDDVPISLSHFAESAVRAYKIAMTPPMGPVLLVADSELQEKPIAADAALHIPKLTLATPPQGDSGSVAEAARMLVRAENPLIVVDRYARTARLRHRSACGAGRNAPSAGDRSGRTNEFSHAASAQPILPPRRSCRQRRRDHGPGGHGFLERAEQYPRSSSPYIASDHEERRKTHQHLRYEATSTPKRITRISTAIPELIWPWRPIRRRRCHR